ncbi:MAG TPA: hypothetical protein VK439_02360 [Rubrivivax sp.]|nr:hypothetical protein [Rubrivivax sp.]
MSPGYQAAERRIHAGGGYYGEPQQRLFEVPPPLVREAQQKPGEETKNQPCAEFAITK